MLIPAAILAVAALVAEYRLYDWRMMQIRQGEWDTEWRERVYDDYR